MRQSRQKFIKKIIPVISAIFIASASVAAEAEVPDITYVSSTSSPYSSAKLEYTKAGTYTWTVPAGVNQIKVTTIGAGGGAGGFQFVNNGIYATRIQAGGGGGAIIENEVINVVPSTNITIVVGEKGETVFPIMYGYYAATFQGGTGGSSYIQINAQNYAFAKGGTGSFNTVDNNANTTSRGPGKAGGTGGGDGGNLITTTDYTDGQNGKYGQGGKTGIWYFLGTENFIFDGKNYADVSSGGGGGSWGNGGYMGYTSYEDPFWGTLTSPTTPVPATIGGGAGSFYAPAADGAVFINYGSASVPVEGIKFDAISSTVGMGSTTTLNYTITPAEATNQTVTWQSSDPAVATIDAATGVVTPVATGRTEITATTEDGGFSDTTLLIVTNTLETIKLKLITESGKYPTFGTVYYKAPGNVIEYPGTAVNASGEMNVSVPSTAEEISLGVSLLNTLISGTVLTPGTKDASATPFYMIEGDFNADNLINGTDWTILVQRMNFGGGETQYGLTGDMNYDGVVDDFDRLLFNSPITHNGEQRFLASGYDMNSINAADASQAREISLDTEKNNDVPAAAPANSIIKINQTEDGRYAVGLSEPSEPVNMLQLSLEGDILNSTYSVPEGFELIGTYEEKGKTVMAIGTAKEGGDVIPSGKPIVTVMAADTPELKYGENDTTMQLATPDGIETVSFESSDSTGKTGTHASGGSSGCNTGTAAIALLAFAPLIIHKSRNRRNDKQ